MLSMDQLESAISCGMAARRPLTSFSISSFMRRPPGNFSQHFVRSSPLELVLGSPSRFSAGLRGAADRSAMDAISSNNGDREVDSEKFKKQFCPDLCDEDLLAQTNYEDFEEQLAEGCLGAERTPQGRSLPGGSGHAAPPDDRSRVSTGCIWTESSRFKPGVAARSPNQQKWSSPAPGTRYLRKCGPCSRTSREIFLNQRSVNCGKDVDGRLLAQPCWPHCPRRSTRSGSKHARCRTGSVGIAEALRTTYKDNDHRTQRWVQLVATANGSRAKDATTGKTETSGSCVEEHCPSVSLPSSSGEAEGIASIAQATGPPCFPRRCFKQEQARKGQREELWTEEGVRDVGRQRTFPQFRSSEFQTAGAAVPVLSASIMW